MKEKIITAEIKEHEQVNVTSKFKITEFKTVTGSNKYRTVKLNATR